MVKERKLSRLVAVMATLAMYALMTQSAAARGGGHGGGGHHGGSEHHASHHGGEHNHHPYHPSHHHAEHHASHHGDHHHDDHHYAHHHHDWHHGDWGPGFWGGAALGYGLGYGWGGWDGWGYGGDTYVDNSTNVTPASNESDDSANDTADTASDDSNDDSDHGFPTDNWPELGIETYAGEYGGSQGQVIMQVIPGSAAQKAGLVPGDVILSFNDKPVPSADDLESALDTAGGKFEVEVWDARTGRKSTLSGALDAAAPPQSPAPASRTTAFTPIQ